ncbi:hypothetical protein GCM10020254_79290 [Streptomyces goshikiensis]
MFGQVALLAHDLAHRQVFRLRKASELSGRIAGNFGIGMGYGWWQDKHTRHHANPNHEDLDPDLDADILVWTQDQARAARGPPRLLGRSQAFLFFPLLTLEGFNPHVSGVRSLFDRSLKHRVWEGGPAHRALCRLPRRAVPGAAARRGGRVPPRPPVPLRRLPRLGLRPEPQGYAGPAG